MIQPEKHYFTVKVEGTIPVLLTYKVFAESPEQAIEMAQKLRGNQLNSPPLLSYPRLRTIKAMVYDLGSSLIKLSKNF